ncbi:FecR domain-containing protein [Sphingopyxis sp.]|uniref:FecR family protein n=1 Tax=Sphingopyxis sp. TaxID=1908224 RepID=UPI0025F17E89|nr:FecR domain-containing protein [Sphingopyxis sp.]MBR2171368.1 FecR domain-containing protein [Sphingopyxis sp.]
MRSVEREAAEWAVRMRGTPSEADREAFEQWYAKPGNAEAFAMSEDDVAVARTASRARIDAKARTERRSTGGFRWAVATIAAVGIALGFAWHMARQSDTPQIAAGPMLPGQLRLADGSTVTLMDGAWAEPQFSETERRIRLHGGRARFDVAHDSARPFIVVAGISETKALGTVFEVDARSNAPKVKLVRGSVEVRLGGTAKTVRLVPGESAEVSESGPRLIPAMTSPLPTAEPTTMLAADGLPLGAVIEAANKVNSRPIRLADPALTSLPVTGRFDVTNGARLARKLAAALGLQATDGSDAITLSKK